MFSVRSFSLLVALFLALASFTSALNVPAKQKGFVKPTPPQLHYVFTAHVIIDLSDFRSIVTPEGNRLNTGIAGGNWTDSTGKLIAHVVPGVGGEQGTVTSVGTNWLDVRYAIQFLDGHYGYVHKTGFGVFGKWNKSFVVLETDSPAFINMTEKQYYGPAAVFVGDVQVGDFFIDE